jgi:hypothetical protein
MMKNYLFAALCERQLSAAKAQELNRFAKGSNLET